MNSLATVRTDMRSRLVPIVVGLFVLLGSFALTAPAQAGYYEGYNPCSYRCGYPAYRYYPPRRYYHRCYSCGPRLIYERRYIEREYVERRYGYGGYRRHYGYYPSYRRPYGYDPYGGYRPSGYGYGGVGRRWSLPYVEAEPYAERYEEPPPRPPAPVWDRGDY